MINGSQSVSLNSNHRNRLVNAMSVR